MLMQKVRYDFGKSVQEGFFVASTLKVALNPAWSSDIQATVRKRYLIVLSILIQRFDQILIASRACD